MESCDMITHYDALVTEMSGSYEVKVNHAT